MTSYAEEEPWEAEVGAMLGALPMVDPPTGFIDRALDHRPLHAGRVLTSLAAVCVLAVVAAVLTGATGRATVVPQVDELAQRHVTVQAGILGPTDAEVDFRIDTPLTMPDGFERTRNLAAEDLQQAFYDNGVHTASVFIQDGEPDWEALPEEGLRDIDGVVAWVDDDRELAVVEASGKTVTIVGLSAGEIGPVLDTIPRSEPTAWDRTQELVGAIARQLGYPDRR